MDKRTIAEKFGDKKNVCNFQNHY